MKTLFQKILDGEIPSKIVYKDDVCAAINDINPQAPVHVLLFPAKPIPRIAEAGEEDAEILARLMLAVPKVAEKGGRKDGLRAVINNGLLAGETTPHRPLHISRACTCTFSAGASCTGRRADARGAQRPPAAPPPKNPRAGMPARFFCARVNGKSRKIKPCKGFLKNYHIFYCCEI